MLKNTLNSWLLDPEGVSFFDLSLVQSERACQLGLIVANTYQMQVEETQSQEDDVARLPLYNGLRLDKSEDVTVGDWLKVKGIKGNSDFNRIPKGTSSGWSRL